LPTTWRQDGSIRATRRGHVDLMLAMLERLDRQGRWEEERRLTRELNTVLALLFRWVDLVRSLKMACAAAERFDDWFAAGWSEHELGTLHLAAGPWGRKPATGAGRADHG
jgi:hypothetical protein